ncbi:hypothetical protein Alches_20750 [Alicyclobacillus hesperidum subsp. aegles]|uniref:beta strand repeat-containing protein n=1 Tax=Alicyclobacillus hesperidum TaxID=89784 RepID=UPI002229B16F|nr:hypothetical protein [Alicyclobacillus hesperidum]GLG02034.1 hypothetical protein Alches_20750 [Alicyclobacillus hesperidum subsp. aegles]
MKRTLTSFAAAAVVLGAASPLAFAATSSSAGLTQAGQLPIVVNGQVLSNPYEMTGQDSGNTTGFFPIYYFDQALAKIGLTATWNGTTHTWAITAPGVDASKISVQGGVGTGNTTVTVNGTTVKMFNTQAAKDPAGGPNAQETTYMPIYYIDNILAALGINGTFKGQTGLSISTPQVTSINLSQLSLTGQTVGTGSLSSPAIDQTGNGVTVSTTVTDQNGNPVPNANVTFNFAGANAPTVTNGTTNVAVSATSTGWSATVATNAQGVASATVKGIGSYAVSLTAPLTGTSSATPVYVGFANSDGVITPDWKYQANISTPTSESTGVVPVVVALPYVNGKPQSGVAVTFKLNGTSSSTAFFSTSTGEKLGSAIGNTYGNGTTFSTYTDANGEATVYVNDYQPDSFTVTATAGSTNLVTNSITYVNPNAPTSSASATTLGLTTSPNPSTTFVYPNSLTNLSTGETLYVLPEQSSGLVTDASDIYNLSLTSGYFTSINGKSLSSIGAGTPSTGQLVVTYNASLNNYSLTFDGYTVGTSANPYFSVGISSSSSSTLTITDENGAKATATYTVVAPANSVTNVQSYRTDLLDASNHSSNVTFTVLDSNGNPVANGPVNVAFDGNEANVWVTAVNGTPLTEDVSGSYAPQQTPVALDNSYDASLGYNGVYVPNVISWSKSADWFTVYTNANGQVTLTLQAGTVPYWAGTSLAWSSSTIPAGAAAATYNVYTYGGTGINPQYGSNGAVYIGSSNPYTTNGVSVGELYW